MTDDSEHVMYVGDCNASLNKLLDTSGYMHMNNVKNRDFVKDMMTEKEMTDVWNKYNVHKLENTCAKNQHKNRTLP